MTDDQDPEIAPASPVGAFPVAENQSADPMTDKQKVRLRHLCDATGEAFDGNLSRRQASARITALEEAKG